MNVGFGAVRRAAPKFCPGFDEEGATTTTHHSNHIQKKGSDGSPESVYASAGAVVAIALRTKPDLRHLVQTRTLNVVPSPASMRTL